MRLFRWTAVPVVFLVLGAMAEPARAQFPLSFVGGITSSTVSGDDVPDEVGSKTGFFVAVGTAIPLSPTVAIEPYVAYAQKGFSDDDGDFTLNYIDIPVFLSVMVPLSPSVGLGLSAGPQISFKASCETPDGTSCDDDAELEEVSSTDFGVLGGAGLGFRLSETSGVFVGAGYEVGLKDVFENVSAKNRSLYFYAGFGFMLGGGGM